MHLKQSREKEVGVIYNQLDSLKQTQNTTQNLITRFVTDKKVMQQQV